MRVTAALGTRNAAHAPLPPFADPPACPPAHLPIVAKDIVGTVRDPRLDEISGITPSGRTADTWWVHNDSGDTARIFAIATNGDVRGEVTIDGADATDWEAIATGPGPVRNQSADPSTPWLYVGDIGDNRLRRTSVQIYRFVEPSLDAKSTTAERLNFTYPGGRSRNAESMFVDPVSGDLFVVSKNLGSAELFRAPREMLDSGGGEFQRVGLLATHTTTTAADISRDGSSITVRTYSHIYEWSRASSESIESAMSRTPLQRLAPDQSEAISYIPGDRGWISIPEGRNAPIRIIARPT